MKSQALAVSLFFLSHVAVAAEPAGYLVFEVDRVTYASSKDGGHSSSEVKQRFKVHLTKEFLANFKNTPSQDSMGTGFCCNGGNLKTDDGSTRFMWWIHKTNDGRLSINMWGWGDETIDGTKVQSHNPSVSQYLKIKRWEDLDMTYALSYVNDYNGINVGFSARYVNAAALKSLGSVPDARVLKAGKEELIKGDDTKALPIVVVCDFQEG